MVKLPVDGGRVAPVLPGASGLLKSTRDYWQTIWASPMAMAWLDADVPALVRLAMLMELVSQGDASAAELGEIRQLEDRFGLSPLARRRLQWEIDQAAGVKADEGPVEQEGRWLRAVSD